MKVYFKSNDLNEPLQAFFGETNLWFADISAEPMKGEIASNGILATRAFVSKAKNANDRTCLSFEEQKRSWTKNTRQLVITLTVSACMRSPTGLQIVMQMFNFSVSSCCRW